VRGLYYNDDFDQAHALVRDGATSDIIWFIIDDPYSASNDFEWFKLSGVPATEMLVTSSYYNTDGMWSFVFSGSNLLSKTYTTSMGYFMRFSYA